MFSQIITKINLKSQITWLSASLIIVTTIVLTTNYGLKTTEFIKQQLQRQMHFAQNVLQQNLKQQEQVLITSASVLAADFGFKQAVATQDTGTIQSVLLNHGKRIDADLMVLLGLEGEFIASNDLSAYSSSNLNTFIAELPLRELHSQIRNINDEVYQVIVVPVKAPRTIGYTIIGFQFDQSTLLKLKELLSLDITLVRQEKLLQSSLPESVLTNEHLLTPEQNELSILFPSKTFYHQSIDLEDANQIKAVLSASLASVYQDARQIILATILAAFIVLLLAIAISRLLAKRLTTPLSNLLNVTKSFSRGNFSVPDGNNHFPPELARLYQGFSVMSNAIKERESKILYQAERDLLTGLFNRQKILTEVESLLANQNTVAIVNFNIKGFKALNDTIGAYNGDLILKEIAKRLSSFKHNQSNSKSVLLSRLHADDFLIAFTMNSEKQLDKSISHLREELNKLYWIEDLNLTLQCYFGVAHSAAHGTNAEKLFRRAMMAAANAVKHQQLLRYYQAGEDEAYLYKLNLIEELKQALEQENSPLFMNYQPKLNINTGKVDKAEALIRWINKNDEFVNPELFVALAEQAGLIVQLSQWVISEVIKQISQWDQQGYQFNVSINLSAQDIQHEGFVNYLLETIEKFEVKAEQVVLELTERDIAENEDLVTSRLTHLKTLGFELSIDDYGIGQSSLAKLRNLPIDELKIDKCFILTLDQSTQDQDIVASTINLGHKLGLRVVAEGVENEESLNLLKQFGCDYAQGYHLSRPQNAEQLLAWYDNYVSKT